MAKTIAEYVAAGRAMAERARASLPWRARRSEDCECGPYDILDRVGLRPGGATCPDDAALIAAAVNAYPRLLAVVEAAQAYLNTTHAIDPAADMMAEGDLRDALAALLEEP